MGRAAPRTGIVKSSRASFDPEPWRNELLGFVRRMGAARDAEDLVQETFLRAIQAPAPDHPRAWLHRIALRLILDRARSARRRAGERGDPALARLEHPDPDPAECALDRDLARAAARVVRTRPPRQRAALILRIQRHMDYDEVALALDCSVPTARQHFHLAVKAVRDALAEGER